MKRKVLVCGGRDFSGYDVVSEVLDQLHADDRIGCIIQGGATGADALGELWARDNGVCCIEIRANWDKYTKGAAGPIRNAWMLKYGQPDLVVAFPTKESRGTWDMVEKAKKAVPCSFNPPL